MAEYIITAPRYVKQIGQAAPEYVIASPSLPATIHLPDCSHEKLVQAVNKQGEPLFDKDGEPVMRKVVDKGLHLKAPPKPAAAHAKSTREPVKRSHEVGKLPVAPPADGAGEADDAADKPTGKAPEGKVRAADK